MLSVVTWHWHDDAAGKAGFGPEYVNNLYRGLIRHLKMDFQFHCITDRPDSTDYDPEVLTRPMYTEFASMKAGARACFRRLRIFDREMAEVFGPRILQMDLDAVVTGDVTPLFDRPDPLVLVRQGVVSGKSGRIIHNPSMLLMDAGVLHEMWARFRADPDKVWNDARGHGWSCSDMSVINDYLNTHRETVTAATWGDEDKVQPYWRRDCRQLWPDARIVLFFGKWNPGDPDVLQDSPWIREHWR